MKATEKMAMKSIFNVKDLINSTIYQNDQLQFRTQTKGMANTWHYLTSPLSLGKTKNLNSHNTLLIP
jgi:enoyl-[acyl-carrier-protein] reductase (NADH)